MGLPAWANGAAGLGAWAEGLVAWGCMGAQPEHIGLGPGLGLHGPAPKGSERLAAAPSSLSRLAAAGCVYWRAMSSGVLPELACSRTQWRLQPHVMKAVTVCDEGCNRM